MNGLSRFHLRTNSVLGLSSLFSVIPNRSTYVLKRKHAPLLSRQDSTRHRTLKGKHFIYEMVQDTHKFEPPDIQVILSSFVEGVGNIGDVISVMAPYARNHLVLPKRAVYATPENIQFYSELKKGRQEMPEFSSIYAGMTIKFLQRKVVPVMLSSEENWTIQPWHVRVAFRIQGIVVPEEAIKLPDTPIVGPDPALEDKDFAVFVTINNTEGVPVRCRLLHLKLGVGITKLSEDFYLERRDAVLEEQQELLANQPLPEIEDNRPEANISLIEKYRIRLVY